MKVMNGMARRAALAAARPPHWLVMAALLAGCAAPPGDRPRPLSAAGAARARPASEPAAGDESDAAAWKHISDILGRPGVLANKVYTVTIPRDDLDVSVEQMEVPTAAGIESSFRFYRCPCGKINVIGQFVTADYEANDVIDALRQKQFVVASLGPLLVYERPRLMLIRFQAESGEEGAAGLARVLKSALDWTGKARLAPQKPD